MHGTLPNTPHPGKNGPFGTIVWGAATAHQRGPLIGDQKNGFKRNVIGAHGGPYSIYAGLAGATGQMSPRHRPDMTNTLPAFDIPFNENWAKPGAIVSLDPWGLRVSEHFRNAIHAGADIRPTIAVTTTRLTMPETMLALREGAMKVDGQIIDELGVKAVKISIDPVWHLPGIANRLGVKESVLRRSLYDATGGAYNDLVKQKSTEVFLPPIGGTSVYVFGDISKLGKAETHTALRIHDECNGSDVFSADICSCRPYLAHGVNVCIEAAQHGGVGVIVYNRKEGRALGEVVKLQVYNAREQQPGGDRAETYFERTCAVAGVEDARVQALMPDVLTWLGITRIDDLLSMSNMKYDAIIAAGIEVVTRRELPPALIPLNAAVEIGAKVSRGYYPGARGAGNYMSQLGCDTPTPKG